MNAAKYDITIDRASEYDFILTIQNYSQFPIDLSENVVFYSDIREVVSKKIITSFSYSFPNQGTDGRVSLSLPESSTLLLNPNKKYEYDIFMARGEETTCLLYGSVFVRANITKGVPIDPII